jgi:hypothetical protein
VLSSISQYAKKGGGGRKEERKEGRRESGKEGGREEIRTLKERLNCHTGKEKQEQ